MRELSAAALRGRSAALIIAGGFGARFWPAARSDRPKPLFSLNGRTSLLDDTIARLQPLIAPERIFVLVPATIEEVFAAALKDRIPRANLLLEPDRCGTAVAIAYGGALIKSRLGEALMAVMPADHYIYPPASFRRTLAAGMRLAARNESGGSIVIIGVPPSRPDPGYGYLEIGQPLEGGFSVKKFVEKPSAAVARSMLRSGKFLWNAGMFLMSIATLEGELSRHTPRLLAALPKLVRQEPGWERLYKGLKFDSFDYEVVEKSARVAAVRADFSWNDVGSWDGLWQTLRDGEGNALSGNVVAMDSKQVLARGGQRLMVLLGVEDLIVVDTPDALLVANRSRTQDVKGVVKELRRRRLTGYI
ncbi:MAG TPA: sugar phosphate nucleotidyltransferase [Candidatus Binataceae bacterium]|nr:sugar phosphate nucleotidyltransferase [Candidatus Binataceae bacterium]